MLGKDCSLALVLIMSSKNRCVPITIKGNGLITMQTLLKITCVGSFVVAFFLVLGSSLGAYAQNTTPSAATSVDANTEVSLQASPASDARSQSGGNVFDFSNGGRNTPPGPSLPSFAGGPCMGVSGGVSAAGPGFAIGAGRSFEDKACQRRNWVQTLVGVSQHMPAAEASELKRVAITLMMQDEFLAPAFAALGYDTEKPGQPRQGALPVSVINVAESQPARRQNEAARTVVRGAMNQGCVTVVPSTASPNFIKLLEKRGCAVEVR